MPAADARDRNARVAWQRRRRHRDSCYASPPRAAACDRRRRLRKYKSKGSPYSTAERRVPELILVLGS